MLWKVKCRSSTKLGSICQHRKFLKFVNHVNGLIGAFSSALVQLLHECVNNDVNAHSTNLVMKCLWRLIKCMPPWADEIDYDSVLYELHCFFKDFPSLWWKGKTDTPLRTIKTILHSMAKMKGAQLMLHLGKIPNTAESELESYILRLLKVFFISHSWFTF